MLVPQTGCYSRVVHAEGAAASKYDVYEPNLKTEQELQADREAAKKPSQDAESENKKWFFGLF